MINEVKLSFLSSMQMLEDGIRKIPDSYWRQGSDDHLIPVRIAYHTFIGLEWLVTNLPEEEHRRTRRYNLNWQGPVADMPDRQVMLDDLAWMTGRIDDWFAAWEREAAEGVDTTRRLKKALYFLRHTQHHIGEFSAAARLLGQERPAWAFPEMVPASVKENP
ncbi:MAG: hypothetical protein ACYDBB_26825 [Armatimonadota bacterium]